MALNKNGANILLNFANKYKIEHIFCSPIAALAPLWEELALRKEQQQSDIPRYWNCRHELLAVGLGWGFAKVTNKPQMVCLPTGLGVLNGSMGLRSAFQVINYT